jgi:thioredoxin reductase (NADPH)
LPKGLVMENAVVRLYGKRESPQAYAIRDFLQRSDVPFDWVELRDNDRARAELGLESVDDERLPICIFPDGTRMERPTVRQVTEKLGWFRNPSRSEYDVAIYGAGPAGLSAAVYAASEGLKTALIERFAVGGQAGTSPKIENYLGFPQGISGAELAERAREQAYRFGAEILLHRTGVRGEFLAGMGIGYLDDGTKIIARASVCATGVEYRRLNLPNEDRLLGAGVYYGAGASEAKLCSNEHVVLVGAGNSSAQASLHLARYAAKVIIVMRGDSLKANVSEYLVHRIQTAPNIEVLPNTVVSALHGDRFLRAVTLRNLKTGEERVVEATSLFLCLGGVPNTQWAAAVGIVRDEEGYLVTGPDLGRGETLPANWALNREPYYLETNMPGVFAAGDVRHCSIKRLASAVGEGAMVVAFVHRYLARG